MKKKDNGIKKPTGVEYYYTTPTGLAASTFCPKLETLQVLKRYTENYKIIEVISNEKEVTTAYIAKKIELGRRRTLDILKELRDAGILESKKDERNKLHWSHTKHKGIGIHRLFTEMCNIIEKPMYRATSEEISSCLELIKKPDPESRELGLKYLIRMSLRKSIGHDMRVMRTLMAIIKDPSYDNLKDTIINCFFIVMPDPLKDPKKHNQIEKLSGPTLEQDLEEQKLEELRGVIEEFYPDQVLRALERYCFKDPFSLVTIPLTLTLMRMVDEELAVKNMVRVVENPPYAFHYQHVLLPARGLSTPMRGKLHDGILKLGASHSDKNVCIRANHTLSILMDVQ